MRSGTPLEQSNSVEEISKKTGIALIVLFCLIIFVFRSYTAHYNPITWDEPVYLRASQAYVTWAQETFYSFLSGNFSAPFSRAQIDKYWERHMPHPPFSKILNGITWFVFSPVFGDLASLRAGSALAYACLFGMVLWWTNRLFGWAAAAVSAVVLLVNPRLFFHAGTANLDTIGMVLTFATVFYFWKTADQKGWIPLIVSGVLWGMANSAKNTAYLALPILVLWPLIWKRKKHLLIRLIGMQFIAVIVFFLLWPWLYHDTLGHLHYYTKFSGLSILWERYLKLVESPDASSFNLVFDQRNFGTKSFPWYYSFTVIYAVIPIPALLLLVAGTAYFFTRPRNADLGMIILGAWVPVLTTCLPSAPVYDMERFLILAIPFQAIVASYAVCRMLESLSRMTSWSRMRIRIIALVMIVLSFIPAIKEWIYIHPQELSYFNAFVGGLPGAVRKGYPPTYWLAAYPGVFRYLNEQIPNGTRVAPENRLVYSTYKEFGLIKENLGYCRTVSADAAVRCSYLIRQEPIKENQRAILKNLYTFSLHGVPLASVYEITPEFLEHMKDKDRKRLEKSLQQEE